MPRSLLIFLFAAAVGHADARAQDLTFYQLSQRRGLTSNYATSVVQDSVGFIWIGTWDGLNRFDGTTVRRYFNDPNDETSVGPGNRWVCTDRVGHLWVSGVVGISRYDYATDSFVRYAQDHGLRSCTTDHEGSLWVRHDSDEGMMRYNEKNDVFEYLPFDSSASHPLLSRPDRALMQDRDRSLWVIASDEIAHLRPDGSVRTYGPPSSQVEYRGLWRRNGYLWVAGQTALDRIDIESGQKRTFADPALTALLEAPVSIYVDERHRIWIDRPEGVVTYDTKSSRIQTYAHQQGNPTTPMSRGFPSRFFEDRSGAAWLPRFSSGVVYFEPNLTQMSVLRPDATGDLSLPNGDVLGVTEARDGRVWIGTRPGLSVFRPGTGVVKVISSTFEPTVISHPFAWDITETEFGVLWIGTGSPGRGALTRYKPSTGQATTYRADPADPTSLSGDWVYTAKSDANGDVWVGTQAGLDVLRRGQPPFLHVIAGDSVGRVFDIEVHPAGSIWATSVSAAGLVFRVNPTDLSMQLIGPIDTVDGLEAGVVTDLTIDEHGDVWGASTSGLVHIDDSTLSYRVLSKANSRLPVGRSSSVLADHRGHIWLGTDSGLIKYGIDSATVVVYGEDRGIADMAFSSHSHRGASGRLYFPTTGGLVHFHPDELTVNRYPPIVILSGLKIHDREVRPGPKSALKHSILTADEIVLTHEQDVIELGFAALHFAGLGSNTFEVLMEGFDRGWRDVGASTVATYTNLSPGRYMFRVRAFSRDGVMSAREAAIRVRVLPPWWLSLWAYIGYGLILLVVSYSGYRAQRQRLIRAERQRTLEREAEQARRLEKAYAQLEATHEELQRAQERLVHSAKMASLGEVTAGIAHEIKNPLNFVNNFASVAGELLEDLRAEVAEKTGESKVDSSDIDELIDDLTAATDRIAQHGKRADGIVESMLQHTRAGHGEAQLTKVNDFVSEFAAVAYHGFLASHPGFESDIVEDFAGDVGEVEMMAAGIGQVIVNICNNAFYAMIRRASTEPISPTLTIRTKRRSDAVRIEIEDNGPGIPDDKIEQIFQPFYTTKPTGEGSGLGLSMSYDIVASGHGGNLWAENLESGGARFVIELPA